MKLYNVQDLIRNFFSFSTHFHQLHFSSLCWPKWNTDPWLYIFILSQNIANRRFNTKRKKTFLSLFINSLKRFNDSAIPLTLPTLFDTPKLVMRKM